jgi:transcriptional regulator with XRE-family HTH domain
METLGQVLRKVREAKSKTLREVEESTGISNAYLSQLENDKIKRPSASVLYKLSDLYQVELEILLRAAGIIEKKDKPNESALQKRLAFMADKLTEEEKKEILTFMEFLSHRRDNA